MVELLIRHLLRNETFSFTPEFGPPLLYVQLEFSSNLLLGTPIPVGTRCSDAPEKRDGIQMPLVKRNKISIVAGASIAVAFVAASSLGLASSASAATSHSDCSSPTASSASVTGTNSPFITLGSVGYYSVYAGAAATAGASDVIDNHVGAVAALTLPPSTTYERDEGSVANTASLSDVASLATLVSSLPATSTTCPNELGGLTLAPGVYNLTGAIGLTGDLTLVGGVSSQFVIRTNAAMTVAASSHVILEGGVLASNVFWEVTGAATLGASDEFSGTIISQAAITVGASSDVHGNLYAAAAITVGASSTVGLDHKAV